VAVHRQPIELVKLSQMARSRADSTLHLFVQDILAAVDEAGLNRNNSVSGFAVNERHVSVNGKKIGDIKELLEYSIFDIAAVTMQFNEKGTYGQRDAHPVTICLTTYKNIN